MYTPKSTVGVIVIVSQFQDKQYTKEGSKNRICMVHIAYELHIAYTIWHIITFTIISS